MDPRRTGGAAIHLYLLDPSGLPAANPDELTVSMALPSAQVGPLGLHAVVAGPDHEVHGADLPLPDQWELTVKSAALEVRRAGRRGRAGRGGWQRRRCGAGPR